MENKVGLFVSLKDGQKYMELWPMRRELNPLFPEQRVIRATKFGIAVMPAIAAISLLTQMVFSTYGAMPQAIITALFAISLPIQGIWWLGHRSNKALPPALASWYHELHQRLTESGYALEPIKPSLRYKELAILLNRAFRQLDKSTLERWF